MMDILVPKLIPVPPNYHPYSYMKAIRKTRASLVARMVKTLLAMQETWVQSLGWEDPLEEGMAAHSSILAWRIPWTEKSGRQQSMGLQRVRHDWVTKHSTRKAKQTECIFFKTETVPYNKQQRQEAPKRNSKASQIKQEMRISLVVQWLRIYLPMQGTRVWSLVWEDSTCLGTTKSVCHNYWAPEPPSYLPKPQLLKPACLEAVLHEERGHGQEKPPHGNKEWHPPPPQQLERADTKQWKLSTDKK